MTNGKAWSTAEPDAENVLLSKKRSGMGKNNFQTSLPKLSYFQKQVREARITE